MNWITVKAISPYTKNISWLVKIDFTTNYTMNMPFSLTSLYIFYKVYIFFGAPTHSIALLKT
jgi:hypothetical protein